MNHFIVVKQDNMEDIARNIRDFLKFEKIETVKRYDVYETSSEEKNYDALFDEYSVKEDLKEFEGRMCFRYRQILGQYNARESHVNHMLKNLLGKNIVLHHSVVLEPVGLTEQEFEIFRNYQINPIENEIVPFTQLNYEMGKSAGKDLEAIDGFLSFGEKELSELTNQFSMDLDDLKLCQEYFKEENRDPSTFELKVIDTYWSDHCRHTTFLTALEQITVEDGKYKEAIEKALDDYRAVRQSVGRTGDITLMDMATINAKYCKANGYLDDIDESDEVNACCVNIKVDVDGKEEDYLLYFKNETHNHPTEIEPFGGAATCIGGGIRDPLSGRSYVHQAMRITGAKDPRTAFENTRKGKLPQRVICQKATEGYSDYGNEIGQTAGYLKEFYDDGFEAKRLELGALVAAAPKESVVRKVPVATDKILLIGGKTGRDGLGAAVGSSKVQTTTSLALQGAEVQKGDPMLERKIIRLFRRPEACRLIKKCNDFGAGGVSVAVGELADGLHIELDQVPVKYPGMSPDEIALSESQERMAVVVANEDVDTFLAFCHEEDLDATVIATVTDEEDMEMTFHGEVVFRMKRAFLNSNGAKKHAAANIISDSFQELECDDRDVLEQLQDIQHASQKALGENFDFMIGKATVLAPFGGKNQLTPQDGMVSKLPVLGKHTDTVSVMAMSYLPKMAKKSPFHAAYYATLRSVAKCVALGVPHDKIRLSFQEFFERLGDDKDKWGKPAGSLLGAVTILSQLNLASIGGKDSMSGTFEDLTVPPSLFSFAVGTTKTDFVVSRELKHTDSEILLLSVDKNKDDLLETKDILAAFDKVERLLAEKKVRSITVLDDQTIENALAEMAMGNEVGCSVDPKYLHQKYALAFLIEMEKADGICVATTNDAPYFVTDRKISFEELKKAYMIPLEKVYYPVEFVEKETSLQPIKKQEAEKSTCRILMPILSYMNGEYDLYESLHRFTDHVDTMVIREDLAYEKSVDELVARLDQYDALAFADGKMNEPVFGKSAELFFRHPKVQKALDDFRSKKYILAIGQSFAGLVKAGYFEKEKGDICFKKNPYGKFVSGIATANVVKDSDFSTVGSYQTTIASTNLILSCDELKYEDQILSKFITFFEGESAVDAMQSENGHLFGILSNIERFDRDGLKNIEVTEGEWISNFVRKAGK